MADTDDTARARPADAPRSTRKPTNPLSRPYWLLGLSDKPSLQRLAEAAALATGAHAVAGLLANSEAFRALQESCQTTDPTQTPFTTPVTEALFAALYMLSRDAMDICVEMLERAVDESEAEA